MTRPDRFWVAENLSGLKVATNALYDLIKNMLAKKGVHKRTEIMQMDQPDGTHLLVIKIIEE